MSSTGYPLLAHLRGRGLLVLDGGLATELEARGHDLGDTLWSARLLLDDPGAIRAVHRAYVDAGADVLVTSSYQASIGGVRGRGLDDARFEELLRLSVRLAREAAGPSTLVAASVGPYGAACADGSEYTGAYDLDEEGLIRWHRRRFEVLAAAGADLLACETIPSLREARALARLLDEAPAASGAWFSFTCRDAAHLSDGTPIAECAALLEPHDRVLAVGVNCTAPPFVEPLVRTLRAATIKPIVAYPNSGETWDAAHRCWRGARDPASFADLAARWRDAGATLIGGCCRTGPAHIRALRARLAQSRS